jgi:hypothetical protein
MKVPSSALATEKPYQKLPGARSKVRASWAIYSRTSSPSRNDSLPMTATGLASTN